MKRPIFYDICKELIDPDEDYHLGPVDEFYHADCCPNCGAESEEDTAADARWREFLANELMSETAEKVGA